jgi:hypothetical protein
MAEREELLKKIKKGQEKAQGQKKTEKKGK